MVYETIIYNSSSVCWVHFEVRLHWIVLSIHDVRAIKKFAFMRQHMPLSSVFKNQWIIKNTLINHYTEFWTKMSKAKLTSVYLAEHETSLIYHEDASGFAEYAKISFAQKQIPAR